MSRDLSQAFQNWWKRPDHLGRPTWRKAGINEGFAIRDLSLQRLNRKWGQVLVPKCGFKFRITREWRDIETASSARVTKLSVRVLSQPARPTLGPLSPVLVHGPQHSRSPEVDLNPTDTPVIYVPSTGSSRAYSGKTSTDNPLLPSGVSADEHRRQHSIAQHEASDSCTTPTTRRTLCRRRESQRHPDRS